MSVRLSDQNLIGFVFQNFKFLPRDSDWNIHGCFTHHSRWPKTLSTFASRLGLKHTWMFHTHGCLTHHKLWPAKPFDIRWHSLRCLLVPSYPNNLNMKWWGKKVFFIISQYDARTWNWGFHVNTRSAPLFGAISTIFVKHKAGCWMDWWEPARGLGVSQQSKQES